MRQRRRDFNVAEGIVWLLAIGLLGATRPLRAGQTQGVASWYSAASAQAEGSSGIMANGRPMDDRALTAASWDFPLGSSVIVRCQAGCAESGRAVRVTITDRGPARELYHEGRIIDLSPRAFRMLAPLEQGLVGVSLE